MTLDIQNFSKFSFEIDPSCIKYQLADDRQLLSLIKSANSTDSRCAWSILYQRHQLQIRQYIKSRVFNKEDAQDISQRVWCVATGKLQDFIWQDTPIVAWLQQITKNQIAKHIETSQRNKRIVEAMALDLQATDKRHTDEEDYRYILLDAIARLKNPMHREIILLHYLQELSINEIAEKLDKKANTIAQAHKRALKHLRLIFRAMMEDTNAG